MCSSSGVLLNATSFIRTAPTTQEESRYTLSGTAVRKRTRGPTMFHMFLSFLVLQLFVNLQIHPFRPKPSHSANDSHSYRFRTQSFSRSALNGGPENIFFQLGSNPYSVSLHPTPSFTSSARCTTFWQRVTDMHSLGTV